MKTVSTVLLMCAMTLIAPLHAQSDKAAAVDALLKEFDLPDGPGAAVMVIRDGKILHARGYGLADVESRVPCSMNTNFRLASVSKQFTAMAVLMLAEHGKLSLDDRLTKFFPEFPAYGEQITVRQLLNHTSGLPGYEDLIPDGTTIPMRDKDVLWLMLRTDKTHFPPGTKYRYSNTGYALLALIVEKASGQTFAAFLKDNIFAPLQMKDTVAYEPGLARVSHRAYGHSRRDNGWEKTDQSVTSAVLGDGGIYSSVADLYQWDQALYTARLVSADTLKQAFAPGPATDKPQTHYGYGWYVGEHRGWKKIWHTGSTIGFANRIERIPEKNFTVILLTNRRNADLGETMRKIIDLYLE